MFNSISDWIKIPQVQVPNVNMPKIPDIFGMNKNKEGEAAANENMQEQQAASQSQQPEATATATVESSSSIPTSSGASAAASAESGGEPTADQEKKGSHHQIKIPIDIDATKALGQAKEIGTNIGNMLFNFGKNASNNVMKTATHLKDVIEKTSIISDFTDENDKFVSEKKNQQRREEAAVPPWVGYNEEDKLKEQIMELSTDSRNFLRSPPDGVDFNFDYNAYYPIALATLEEDSNLKAMRFKLVPAKINEENFWRNYFYRVSLIKQSTQLSELSESNTSFANDKSVESELNRVVYTSNINQEKSGGNNEFVSDSYNHDAISADEIKSDLKQLKLDSKKADDIEDTDWDKELPEDLDSISAEDLEKEINQMIGKQ